MKTGTGLRIPRQKLLITTSCDKNDPWGLTDDETTEASKRFRL